MAKLLVLYNQPADPAAFDHHYFHTHVPIAKKIHGMRSFTVSTGKPTMVAGSLSPYLIAELEFDSVEALRAAMASPEGQAAAKDLNNFAQAGATVLEYDTRAV